ncbi:MAG: prenyltransferase/squalene oxidase repeat-containing protein [Planctomycetota bacterium]
MALAKSGKAEYQPVIAKAQKYLLGLQADEGEGYSEGDRWYGGIGYGDDERPDLSNLQMALEALDASGLPKDHEAYQRAIKFLERCQNRSESNDISIQDGDVIITSGNDGGSAYMPGDSKAGYVTLPGGKQVPRSYGSMTYALLKSYVIAGLPADDARVKAAFDWLQKNYTLDVNPGFDTSKDPRAAYQGLFYYYMAMSRALSSLGVEELVDADGKAHAWRRELAGRLLSLQSKENGSWINRNAPRWWEGNPMLGTAYALGALSETLK